MSSTPVIHGLVPNHLKVRSTRIILEGLEIQTDIGFHDFEVGAPQKLLVSIEIWLEDPSAPLADDPAHAWNYDVLRHEVERIAQSKRFNLQETLAHEMFDFIAAHRGVAAARIRLSKPDVYPEAQGVGVEISSFEGLWPQS